MKKVEGEEGENNDNEIAPPKIVNEEILDEND
jgi:hypothetical protein